jgi:hypothetical protein
MLGTVRGNKDLSRTLVYEWFKKNSEGSDRFENDPRCGQSLVSSWRSMASLELCSKPVRLFPLTVA